MENKSVKKVIVELENGNKLEFDKQVVIFAEDEMSATEKMLHDGDNGKICGILRCNPNFMANVTESLLSSLKDAAPGLDAIVMSNHIGHMPGWTEMLAKILG